MIYLTNKQAADKNLIRYLAEQIVPESIKSLERLDGGVTSNTYEINRHLIFKLPGFRTPVEKWDEQSQCAPILQKHFSVQIPHPKLKSVFLSTSAQIPLLASLCEKIEGYTIPHSKDFFKKEPAFKQKYFEQLADFTHQLHDINPNELPVHPPTAEEFLKRYILKKIDGMNQIQKRVFYKIIRLSCFSHLNSEETVLCHCDLRPANICLDKKDNIVGILDFDSLNRGKRFMEFRPNLYGLYGNEADTKQFCHTYYQQINQPNPTEQFQNMRHTLALCYIMSRLFKYQNNMTHLCKKAISLVKNLQRVN